MPLPALPLIDEARISPMRASEGEAQGIGVGWDDDEMDVIGHQTICEKFDACRLAALVHPFAIGGVIGLAKECLHTAIATLSDMMSNAWNDYAG